MLFISVMAEAPLPSITGRLELEGVDWWSTASPGSGKPGTGIYNEQGFQLDLIQ